VIVIATLGAPERRFLDRNRTRRPAPPEPDPAPVTTGRATVVEVGEPFADETAARAWLQAAGEDDLEQGLRVLNRALHAFRVVTADPHVHAVARSRALVARIGFGAGEAVADGLWSEARELTVPRKREKRSASLMPQSHLSAVLTGSWQVLACQELTLRARDDLDQGRPRDAALQLLVALDAAIAELARDSKVHDLQKRLDELRARRDSTAAAAQAALAGPLDEQMLEDVDFTLRRIEAALRARAFAHS
jgi:hypothetical protein